MSAAPGWAENGWGSQERIYLHSRVTTQEETLLLRDADLEPGTSPVKLCSHDSDITIYNIAQTTTMLNIILHLCLCLAKIV